MTLKLEQIYQPIQSPLDDAEALFVSELQQASGLLGEMTRYVTKMPGKRVRPALALLGAAVAETAATDAPADLEAKAVKLATAVEMIHTATLLHDDVIDGATLRRGLRTLHDKWGDTLAVLSGDFLYSKAFCLISELEDTRILNLLADTARAVCEGEVAQIHHRFNLELSLDDYMEIILNKTASLMAASAEAGALLAGVSKEQAQALGAFGKHYGLAFQILDDTRDLIGSEDMEAKTLGTDLGQGQITLPLIYLKEKGDAQTKEILSLCFNGNGASSEMTDEEKFLKLRENAIALDVQSFCNDAAQEHLDKAYKALEIYPESPYKQALLQLNDFLLQLGVA